MWEVIAYETGKRDGVLLGSIAEQIYVNGFKSSEERNLVAVRLLGGTYDRVQDYYGTTQGFSFAAGRSFGSGSGAVGEALLFLGNHRTKVPRLADIKFTQNDATVWLLKCGIKSIPLVAKNGSEVVFSYEIIGGYWDVKRDAILT